MARQPGTPKSPPYPDRSAPAEGVNHIVFDGTDHLTPEQKMWPVRRLRGVKSLAETLADLGRPLPAPAEPGSPAPAPKPD